MQLRRIALQNFRNIAWAELALPEAGAALVGTNAQGKTNLLEAVGLLTALRSFRQSDNRLLIAHSQPEAALRFELEHERLGPTTVTIRLRPDGKEVEVDATPVARYGDFLASFPQSCFPRRTTSSSAAARARGDAGWTSCLRRWTRATSTRSSATTAPSTAATGCSRSGRTRRNSPPSSGRWPRPVSP
jgi:DNA replication and repair protein RecF